MTSFSTVVRTGAGVYRMTHTSRDIENADVPLHSHTYYELHYVLSGACRFTAEGTELMLHEGESCILTPGAFHCRRVMAGGSACGFGLQMLSGTPILPDAPLLLRLDAGSDECRALAGLTRELHDRSAEYRTAAEAWCALLVTALLRRTQTAGEQSTGDALGERSSRIDSYMADNLCNDPTPGALAELLNITPRQLERVMRQLYGMTFARRLRLVRLNNARHLLRTTDLAPSQVALRCGFSGAPALYEAFRQELGVSPTAWRNENYE